MFCENCGTEMDNARFCPICGAEQRSVVISASVPEAPEAASIPAAPSAPIAPEPASIPAAPSAPIAPEAASIPAAPSTPIAPAPAPTVQPAAPTPITVVPAGVSSSPTVIVEGGKPEDRKRKYTGGHIALCLITAAIMAGVAGIFAGLYFSLLWSIR